jgi:hypothetical protein
MPDHSVLLAALEAQAAADPESPCLFWPEGWNWRWWSWRQVAALAARWSAPLAGLPAGAGVAFAGDSYPQAIALDLAVQAAGLTPVPVAGGGGAGPDVGVGAAPRAAVPTVPAGGVACVAWLEAAAGEARVTRLDGAAGRGEVDGEGDSAGGGDAASGGDAAGGGHAAGDGPGILVVDARGAWLRLSPPDLLAAVARVESALGAPAGGRGDSREREILVAGWPLQQWAGRLLTAWAMVAGASLVLDSDPAQRLGTVLWARPTVFHGGAAEVAALRSQVAAARRPRRWRGWRRLPAPPLGRLRTLFQLETPAPGEVAFWHERGARLVQLPGPGGAGQG